MEEIKLRKYEHALVISGVGVIAFGVWSVIKAAIYFILFPLEQLKVADMSKEIGQLQSIGLTDRELGYMLAAAILFAMLLDCSLRLYIGRSALMDGRRLKKKRFTYVVIAMFIAAGLITNIMTRCLRMGSPEETAWSNVIASANVSVFVDITSVLALVEMIIAAIMVRRLRKEIGTDETEVA